MRRGEHHVAGYSRGGANLTGGCQETECEPRRVNIIQARATLWSVLGVAPASFQAASNWPIRAAAAT